MRCVALAVAAALGFGSASVTPAAASHSTPMLAATAAEVRTGDAGVELAQYYGRRYDRPYYRPAPRYYGRGYDRPRYYGRGYDRPRYGRPHYDRPRYDRGY